jgi:hypothetical protein
MKLLRKIPEPESRPSSIFGNHFLEPVMARVIHEIEQSLQKNPREANLIYYNPKARRTVDRSPVFRLLSETRAYCVYRSVTEAASSRSPEYGKAFHTAAGTGTSF